MKIDSLNLFSTMHDVYFIASNKLSHTFNLYNHILVKSTYQFYMLCSTDIDIGEIWRLIKKAHIKNYADLYDLLKPLIADLANEMFAVGLITNDVLNKPTYSDIMGDFLTRINFMKNHTELQEHVNNFLMILNYLGGLCSTHVSNTSQVDWTEIIKGELHIELNFMVDYS